MTRITDEYLKFQRRMKPNLDISYRCVFRCPQCIRQHIISQDQIRRSFDLDEENFKKILKYYTNGITFCGQISDPIYHPNFLNFLKLCNKQECKVRIATVGSGKSDQWWNEAWSYGLGKNAWYFGVDGIDKKSEIYRVGSNFDDVWKRMKQGRYLGHIIVWQYIIFGYNEHEIDRAVEIAKEEDFSLLFVNTNRRFDAGIPTLRKNVNFTLTTPNKQYTQERVKKEWWGYISDNVKKWLNL